jgi:hypothetical protein
MNAGTIIALLGGAWLASKYLIPVASEAEAEAEAESDQIKAVSLPAPPGDGESGQTGSGRWKVAPSIDGGWTWDTVHPEHGRGAGEEPTREEAIGAAQSWLLGGVSD